MPEEYARRYNRMRRFLVIENTIILIIILALAVKGCAKLLTLLDSDPSPYSEMRVHTYPDKLTYVMGKDTALDLTGGELCLNSFLGLTNGVPCDEVSDDPCELVFDMTESEYTSDFDLSREGVYTVLFKGKSDELDMQCAFMVQVISPDYVE